MYQRSLNYGTRAEVHNLTSLLVSEVKCPDLVAANTRLAYDLFAAFKQRLQGNAAAACGRALEEYRPRHEWIQARITVGACPVCQEFNLTKLQSPTKHGVECSSANSSSFSMNRRVDPADCQMARSPSAGESFAISAGKNP